MAAPPPTSASDDYSAAATVTTFPLPLPLLRHPLASSASPNPPLLAFPTPHSFFSALSSARSHLLSQCESGARIGCALRASARCQRPWWHSLLGGAPRGFAERAECEERESRECFEAARGECVRVVRDKCVKGFGGAWVVRVRGGGVCRGNDLLGDDF